jgi:uncharacterized protein GlcG (DUF336 family)
MRKASILLPAFLTGPLLLAAPAPAPAATQALPTQKILPAILAQEAVTTAMESCRQQGFHVSAAVVDQGGNLRAFLRDDAAGPHTISSAERKAFTAASLKAPTAQFGEAIAKNPAIAGLRNMDERILLLAGGLPIKAGSAVIAGIGVGGAPSGDRDAACAQAGIDKIAGSLR